MSGVWPVKAIPGCGNKTNSHHAEGDRRALQPVQQSRLVILVIEDESQPQELSSPQVDLPFSSPPMDPAADASVTALVTALELVNPSLADELTALCSIYPDSLRPYKPEPQAGRRSRSRSAERKAGGASIDGRERMYRSVITDIPIPGGRRAGGSRTPTPPPSTPPPQDRQRQEEDLEWDLSSPLLLTLSLPLSDDGVSASTSTTPSTELNLLLHLPPLYPSSQPPRIQLLNRYISSYAVDSELWGSVLRVFHSGAGGVDWTEGDVVLWEGTERVREEVRNWLEVRRQELGDIEERDFARQKDQEEERGRQEDNGYVDMMVEVDDIEYAMISTPPIVDRKSVFVGHACVLSSPEQVRPQSPFTPALF